MKGSAGFKDGTYVHEVYQADYKPLTQSLSSNDKSYKRWWCINPTIIPDMIAAFKSNRISRLLLGSRVYFPSHVKFSRSRFRHYAKNRASVTQKLELATTMVVDFFFFLKVASQTDSYGHRTPLSRCFHMKQISTDEDFYINQQDYESLKFHADFRLVDILMILNDNSQRDLKSLDELIIQFRERPDISIITYDWLNNRASQQTVEDMPMIIKMLKLIRNGQDNAQVRIGLNFMASMDPRKYSVLLWMMVAQCYSFDYKTRSAFKTTMHYNVMYRNVVKMGRIHFNTITFSNALQPGIGKGDMENSFADIIRNHIAKFISRHVLNVMPLPLFVSKWWLRHELRRYMAKDLLFYTCMFRDPIALTWAPEDRLANLGKHFWGATVDIRPRDPDGHYRVVSQLLGLNFKFLLRYLIKINDEQSQPDSGPQLGERVCQQAENNLPKYGNQSK